MNDTCILEIIRYNESHPIEYVFRKGVRVGRLKTTLECRRKSNLWGRFGGGWNWHVGLQAGSCCVIVFLLVAVLRFEWVKKEVKQR